MAGEDRGALQLIKDNNHFYFQDLGFSEFRVDSSKQNTEPSSYFMNHHRCRVIKQNNLMKN